MDAHGNMVEDPLTTKDLSDLANAYQTKYFLGVKVTVTINVTDNAQFEATAAYEPDTKTIFIAKRITGMSNTVRIALLHEMIHANLHYKGLDADPTHQHPPEFKAEVKRLMKLGAYDDLL